MMKVSSQSKSKQRKNLSKSIKKIRKMLKTILNEYKDQTILQKFVFWGRARRKFTRRVRFVWPVSRKAILENSTYSDEFEDNLAEIIMITPVANQVGGVSNPKIITKLVIPIDLSFDEGQSLFCLDWKHRSRGYLRPVNQIKNHKHDVNIPKN